jgi:K+-transporting ATPase ATPase B chain
MSGVDVDGQSVRKGAADAIRRWVASLDGTVPDTLTALVEDVAHAGGTPLAVAEADGTDIDVLGVVHLKDVVKEGMRQRFDRLRSIGLRTVMITGDNPLTARAIATEAGVDDFLAEATPEDKMALIRREQEGGRLVAMTGDGTNDAPALAQADVGVAMNTGTQAAREAGNMVDLDSNPTKLIEIVEIGKQLLVTRGRSRPSRSPTTWPSTSPSSRRCSRVCSRRSTTSTSCASTRRARRSCRRSCSTP